MRLNPNDLPADIKPVLLRLRHYTKPIYFFFFIAIYAFLLLSINILISSQPDDDVVMDELKTVRRPQIDEDAAEKIERLEDQNIEVRSLFNKARRNPFAE